MADLALTDWSYTPNLQIAEAQRSATMNDIIECVAELLRQVVRDGMDLVLLLEDDLLFNRYLRYNLNHWAPLRGHVPGQHFLASLYNPNVCVREWHEDDAYALGDPGCVFGSQALVASRATVQHVLARWNEHSWPSDLRILRPAGEVTPIYYHVPSLVQHTGVVSTWGGPYHAAQDFVSDWRAPSTTRLAD